MKYKLNKQLSFPKGNLSWDYYVTKNTFDLDNVFFNRMRFQLVVGLGRPINGIFDLFDPNYLSVIWLEGTK